MGREPDVDRQHPELAQHLQEALLGRTGTVKMTRSSLVRRANSTRSSTVPSFGIIGDDVGRTVVGPVVEDAAKLQARVLLLLEELDQALGGRAASDDRGAPIEPSLAREPADGRSHGQPAAAEDDEAEHQPDREKDARKGVRALHEEDAGERDQEDEAPGAGRGAASHG